MFKKIQMMAIALTMCSVASAQQSNVNLSYNPQKDTEGLVPFSASLNSPQVNDDHTVIFRIKAPQASEVKLSGAMLTVMHERNPLPFTKGDDGIWVSEPMELHAGEEFKVRQGLSWDNNFPADNFKVEADGTYVVTFDEAAGAVDITAQ